MQAWVCPDIVHCLQGTAHTQIPDNDDTGHSQPLPSDGLSVMVRKKVPALDQTQPWMEPHWSTRWHYNAWVECQEKDSHSDLGEGRKGGGGGGRGGGGFV